jgi:hypothetical protein
MEMTGIEDAIYFGGSISRSLQIFTAKKSTISLWRGIVENLLFRGLI